MENDLKNIAVILTAHPAQQMFWPAVLQCLERYPGPLILAYDDIDTKFIPDNILKCFAAVTVTGFAAGRLGHGPGELMCSKKGFSIAAGMDIPLALKLGFDTPPYFWRNLVRLRRELIDKNLDVIDCKTAIIFGKTGKLAEIFSDPNLAFRKGSAESYYMAMVGKYQIKRLYYNGWWFFNNLGTVHIHGEYALNAGRDPGWTWRFGRLWPKEK